jgi:gliding motility-associated-like protein
MIRKLPAVFLLLLVGYIDCESQACSTLGQVPQTAFPVCGRATFFQTKVPECSNGSIPVPCNDNAGYADNNPFWYRFTCYQSGTLVFAISPEDLNDDYDWQIFDITGRDPQDVYNDNSLFVVGNWSGNTSLEKDRGYSGITGADILALNNIECASNPPELGGNPPYNDAPTFSKAPNIIQGHNYLLMVSHYSGENQSGYSLVFGGGTASITDPVKPVPLTSSANCSGENIVIGFNKKLQCSSLASNGSDFAVSAPGIKVVTVSGINCSSSFDMDSIVISLSGPLPPGNYFIIIKKGSDNNTLLDNCDNSVPENDSIPFIIAPPGPTLMDSMVPVNCAPSVIQLVFKKPIRCNSIAADGSDFKITGSYPVSVTGASGDNCSNNLSGIINVKLSKPIQNVGNFTITLQKGTDGNTILDECAQATPAGLSLNFVTKDVVSAIFAYSVHLGCTYDTLFYAHDGNNSVSEWNWVFDVNGTSTTKDSFFVFNDYGTKHISLNCSNGVCSDSSAVDILLDNELTSRFNILPSSQLCPEDAAQFVDSSSGRIVGWYWTFGDGTVSTIQNPPPKQYPFPQTSDGSVYPVSLIVKNDINCFDTAKATMKVFYNCYIAVPSAFTPNGDGLNDYLYPLNAYKADNLEFLVYNRWGQLVFRTTDWTKKWDGRISGNPQMPGTYVWMLHYTHHDTGKQYSLKGTTVLIR